MAKQWLKGGSGVRQVACALWTRTPGPRRSAMVARRPCAAPSAAHLRHQRGAVSLAAVAFKAKWWHYGGDSGSEKAWQTLTWHAWLALLGGVDNECRGDMGVCGVAVWRIASASSASEGRHLRDIWLRAARALPHASYRCLRIA